MIEEKNTIENGNQELFDKIAVENMIYDSLLQSSEFLKKLSRGSLDSSQSSQIFISYIFKHRACMIRRKVRNL